MRSLATSAAVPALALAFAIAATSCGGDDDVAPADASTDAGLDAGPTPLEFTAQPDPAERSDCAERPVPGIARAKHVTCADELVPGSLAMGRLGDIVLENARVRFVVRTGPEAASTIGAFGGGIVDAAALGGVDQVKEILPLFDFATARATDVVVTDAGDDDAATVTVLFEADALALLDAAAPGVTRALPLRGAVEYTLAGDSDALSVHVRLSTTPGSSSQPFVPGIVALLGGNGELERPRVGLAADRGTEGDDPTLVSEGRGEAIAIRLMEPEGNVLSVLTIHILQGTERRRAMAGEEIGLDARIAVATSAADAWRAVTDPVPELEARGAPGDRVEITTTDDAFVVRTRLGGDGAARVPVGAGAYRVRSGFGPFFTGAATDVTVDASGGSVDVAPPPSGTLAVDALADGEAAPVRVLVRDEATLDEVLRFVALGPTEARLPPGSYDVAVSRGMEYDVQEETVALGDGERRAMSPILDRSVDTSGWVATDLHLHTDLSTDSRHHVDDAVRILAAEGLEVVASTDHDYITDYAPIVARAGVADWLVVVPGDEVSSTVLGHIGGYPLVPDPDLSGAGAPIWFDRSPAEIFAAVRARGDDSLGGALVQINHPRFRGAGFFSTVALDPLTGHATADPATLGLAPETDLDDFDFDVVEVWNGISRGDNEEAFEDYLGLETIGRRYTMVGNSDSHHPEAPAGAPRSYVRVPDDARGAYDWNDVAAGLRARSVSVAAGIFVTAELAGPRDTATVPVHVHVEAPPWIEVDRLRIYAGRDVAVERPITATDIVRLDQVIDVPIDGPGFVLVRAEGTREALPVLDLTPYGLTNPIDVP